MFISMLSKWKCLQDVRIVFSHVLNMSKPRNIVFTTKAEWCVQHLPLIGVGVDHMSNTTLTWLHPQQPVLMLHSHDS